MHAEKAGDKVVRIIHKIQIPKVMKRAHLLFFVTLLCLFTNDIFASGYEIKFKITGISDTSVILGHRFTTSLIPDDTAWVSTDGSGIFKGEKLFPGGMYFLFVNGDICEFFLDKDQEFYLETDTTNLQGDISFKGSDMNAAWAGFQKNVSVVNKKKDKLMAEKETASEERKKEIDDELKELGKKFHDIKLKLINDNSDNLLGVFMKATEEIEVPDPPKDESGNISDSLFQYHYYRKHYFDNFDYTDARLIRTPIYDEKIMRYINKVVPQVPDTLIKEIDTLIERSRSDAQLFRYMLVTFLNTYAKSEIMGMDAVYLHVAEKYYIPEATWSGQDLIKSLKETVEKQKNLIIGKVAPDVQLVMIPAEHFKMAANDTALKKNVYVGSFFNLHDIKADYIVLYFWSTDCGHCRKSSPKLHDLALKLKEDNAVIIAIHMLGGVEGKEEWVDFVNKNKMYNWINAWNPYSYDYKDKYDMKTTNQIYILDKDKKIIAKRISPEQVEEVINAYVAREKNKKNE